MLGGGGAAVAGLAGSGLLLAATGAPADAATGTPIWLAPSGDTTGSSDATAISNAVQTVGGAAVYLLPGDYYVNSTIELPAGAFLAGTGNAYSTQTRVQLVTGVALKAVFATAGWLASANTDSVPGAYLRDFTIDCNSAATYGLVSQNYEAIFERLLIENSLSDGLRFDKYGANGTTAITNTAVENRVTDVTVRSAGGNGICTNDTPTSSPSFTDGWLTRCVIDRPKGA